MYLEEYIMKSLVFRAMEFAIKAHANQKRKYTKEPYWSHLAEVAGVASSSDLYYLDVNIGALLATSWLHDTVEDCGVKVDDLRIEFGSEVAIGVLQLSDVEEGNRAERKDKAALVPPNKTFVQERAYTFDEISDACLSADLPDSKFESIAIALATIAQPVQPSQARELSDTQRIDFLIDERAYIVSDADACDGFWLHYLFPDGSTWVQVTAHDTPREAIDAAINAKVVV